MSKNKFKKLELLAPAGNFHKLKTALAFGADAVYAGVPDFSLRVRINDFDINSIREATKYCHQNNKKIYVTLNIFAHNKHFKNLEKHLKFLKSIGVDALIISDPGILTVVKKIMPKTEIHLSTQANCTNAQAAKFWQEQGVNRIILGREVTLKEIKEIHLACPGLDLEYFVHGAMCMAYSGRCFLSSLTSGRSANLGDCIQPCRWQYTIQSDERGNNTFKLQEDQHGSYILNSKDLCLIKYLRELRDAGVISFKIEGRAKSAYYQAMIAGVYSHVMQNIERVTKKELNYYFDELETKIINRGYCTGFLLGDRGEQNTDKSHEECDWEFCGQIHNANTANDMRIPRIAKNANEHRVYVKVHNSLKVGDEIEIIMPKYDIIKMKISKMYDSESKEKISEAHGGQGRTVMLKVDEEVPKYSVIRRKIN